jgi:fermentation-respiration switch protein FrsA (DUF1100 family)
MPGSCRPPGRTGVSVLVAPGNAGDRSLRAPLAEAPRRKELSVLLLDYRGYGANQGDPTEAGLALDVRAARQFSHRRTLVRPDRLIYYGESLGAAVVTELATEHPGAGLMLPSPSLTAPGRCLAGQIFLVKGQRRGTISF